MNSVRLDDRSWLSPLWLDHLPFPFLFQPAKVTRPMGKGDPKSKRGKIFKGSFGKKRPTSRRIRQDAKKASAES